MQPDAVLLADRARARPAGRSRSSTSSRPWRRPAPGCSRGRRPARCRAASAAGPHGEVAVDLHDADGVGAEARRCGPPSPSRSASPTRRRRSPGRGRRRAAAVAPALDRCRAASRATRLAPELESWTTPPPVPVGAEGRRQAQQVGEPVHDVLLELGGRRAGHPGHALHAEAGRDQVAEHGRAGGVGREVAEEAGVLPVRDARAATTRSRSASTAENGSPCSGARGGQRGADLAGGDLRAHRAASRSGDQ